MPIHPSQNQPKLFKYRHYEGESILLCLRWYLRYSLSYRDLEEIMDERGLSVDHTTIYRWVQHYAPILEKKCRAKLRTTNDSWRVDETYIKVKGQWMYLCRAVDSDGNTVEFMLTPRRNAVSAKRFFRKALRARHTVPPRVINVDKNPSYPKAVGKLKGTLPRGCKLRPVKYLNNLVEQDHRFIKRRVNPEMGFWSFETAWWTIQGYEATNQLRKGQVRGTTKGDLPSQVRFVSRAFGLAA